MRYILYKLHLPLSVFVDMFFNNLSDYEVILRDEGMVFTGHCEDCDKHYYSKYLHNEEAEIELSNLYCPNCANELFCSLSSV